LYNFNLGEAEEEFKKAIELKPSYAPAHLWYFSLLRTERRWDDALTQIERAVELDPFSQVINLNHAAYYYWRRDYRNALRLLKRATELDPSFPVAHFQLSEAYGRLKMINEATREVETGLRLDPISTPQTHKRANAMIAYFDDDKGKVKSLLPALEKHISSKGTLGVALDAYLVAGLNFYIGEVDKGFQLLEESYSRGEPSLLWITNEPFFDNVRNDPRYLNLLTRLGLKHAENIGFATVTGKS
jgi:tetratricopeptide (TPR) repeat protein